MKKLLVLVLAAAMALCLFTACTGQTDKPGDLDPNGGQTGNPAGDTDIQTPEDGSGGDDSQDGAAGNVNISAFFTQLETDYELGSLVDIEGDVMDNFYPGLSEYTFVQYVGKSPAMTSVVSEYMFLECQSEDDASKVAEILQARVDAQADGGAWYPESMEAWGKAKVIQKGSYAALIAAGDNTGDIAAKFEALFDK